MDLNLQSFINTRILVIGDLMLDRYLLGSCSRISPEAPVPVVKINEINERAGGAGNVALNAKAIGGQVNMLGMIGKDEDGKKLKQLLENAGINCYLSRSTLPTITKMRVIAQNQQLVRLDQEQLSDLDMGKLLQAYKKQIAKTDAVIISDYGKGIAKIAKKIIKIANSKNIPALVDPKGKDFSLYQGAALITPNLAEFETIVGTCKDDDDLTKKALDLLTQNNFAAILVTKGAKGMSLIRPNQKPLHIPTNVREVYDVTGAGDTVIAVLGTALAAGEDVIDAMNMANIAAGITVRKLGAAAITIPELRRALQKKYDSWLGITDKQRLLQDVADAKAHGETIVMTNGCFDVLHPGHIAYLDQAKALGTRLIVAVNDDASVKRLKGSERPINNLEQRMAVLAGLQSTDWVVPFSEDTPEKIIKAVTPDILVKGGDWPTDKIVGADHLTKHGGKVYSLPYVENHSTSEIINKIKQGAKK